MKYWSATDSSTICIENVAEPGTLRLRIIRGVLIFGPLLLMIASPFILSAIHFAKFKNQARKTVVAYLKEQYGWKDPAIYFYNDRGKGVLAYESNGGLVVVDSMSIDIRLSSDGREITHVEEMMNP